MNSFRVILSLLVLFALVSTYIATDATLSKKDRKTKNKSAPKDAEKVLYSKLRRTHTSRLISSTQDEVAVSTPVTERGLVTTQPKWKDIVASHHVYSTSHRAVKRFPGLALGYVTPVCVHVRVCVHVCVCL